LVKFAQIFNIKMIIVFSFLPIFAACQSQSNKMGVSKIISSCETASSYNDYVYCIKSRYASEGWDPNMPATQAFYARLNLISEKFNNKEITEAYARDLTHQSYLQISQVEQSNIASRQAAFFNSLGAVGQQMQSSSVPSDPSQGMRTYTINGKTVVCNTVGTITNCN